jgi:NADH:ubiquinone oxidoreductase subunit 3 (subunit A)
MSHDPYFMFAVGALSGVVFCVLAGILGLIIAAGIPDDEDDPEQAEEFDDGPDCSDGDQRRFDQEFHGLTSRANYDRRPW